jgi:DNA-directed RNA polymerase specialized sigma24 family protein
VELRKRDLTIREIAAELGCSIAAVHRIIKAAESTPTEQD